MRASNGEYSRVSIARLCHANKQISVQTGDMAASQQMSTRMNESLSHYSLESHHEARPNGFQEIRSR